MLESTVTGSESNATGSESIVTNYEITATERAFQVPPRATHLPPSWVPGSGLAALRFEISDRSARKEQFNHRERREPKEKQALGRTDAIICRVRTRFRSSSLLCDPCDLCGYSTAVYRFSGILPFPILSLCSGRFASGDGFRHPAPGARGLQRSESKLCRTGVRPFLRSCHSKPKHKDQT